MPEGLGRRFRGVPAKLKLDLRYLVWAGCSATNRREESKLVLKPGGYLEHPAENLE